MHLSPVGGKPRVSVQWPMSSRRPIVVSAWPGWRLIAAARPSDRPIAPVNFRPMRPIRLIRPITPLNGDPGPPYIPKCTYLVPVTCTCTGTIPCGTGPHDQADAGRRTGTGWSLGRYGPVVRTGSRRWCRRPRPCRTTLVSTLLQRVLFAERYCIQPTSLCGDVVGEAALDVLSDMLSRS